MSTAWKDLEGRTINGALPLLRCIASSDQSAVFLSESAKHAPAAVALKLLRVDPTLADAQLVRWRAAAELSHPHLIRIFEAGQCQVGELHCLYALMERADQSLAQLLAQRALAENEAREMLAPMLSALAYLHERKLVHGQLKPSNILAVGDQLKLASDAVCAVGGSPDGMYAGSPYDAPEMRDGACSAAGDVWALGVTLCEALARRQPSGVYEGGEVELPSDLQPPFREIVARCLSRNPYDRPKVAEIQAWLRGEDAMGAAAASRQPAAAPVQQSVVPESAADKSASAGPAVTQAAVAGTTESPATSNAEATAQSDKASTVRLIIRAQIIPEGSRPTAVSQHSNRRVLALVLGVVAVLALGWIGISVFRDDSTSAPTASEEARDVESQPSAPVPAPREAAPAVSKEPPPKPATSTAGTRPAKVTPVGPSPIKEVIPSVPRSALDTIRGIIRVSIRVIVDKDGTVIEATADEPGPSRYFERLALEAAKKWRFAATEAEEQRAVMVRFYFRREGVTGNAEPVR